MYLSVDVESVRGTKDRSGYTGYRLTFLKVVLNPTGRPAWALHQSRGTWWAHSASYSQCENQAASARDYAKNHYAAVPFMKDAAPGKLVTMAQAEVLTGLAKPVAMDRLAETVNDDPALSNYVKPPKVKKERPAPEPKRKPTRAEIAQAKADRARLKVGEWYERILHAERKHKEWQRKARRLDKRAEQLKAAEATATPA